MRSLALVALVVVACSEPAAPAPSASPAVPAAGPSPVGLIAPAARAAYSPRSSGRVAASAAPEHGHDRTGVVVTTWASRAYRRGDAIAHVRMVDASRAPDLVMGFAAAQQIELPAGPDGFELLPTGVGGRPALASWDPGAASSEAQVLVQGRVIVAVAIQGARAPEDAIELLDRAPLRDLEALLR